MSRIKCPFFLFILGLSTTISSGQTRIIKKVIVDIDSGLPVAGAHVYVNNQLTEGSITNADGLFVIKNVSSRNNLIISHIAYQNYIYPINKIGSDTIRFVKNQLELNEVVITGESVRAVMERVVDSLAKNHNVEPVLYNSYVRVLDYERFEPQIHMVSEYIIQLYNNTKGASEYRIIKARAKPLSEAGEKYFKDMRVIQAIGLLRTNAILKDKGEVFHQKNLDNYHFKFGDVATNESYINIECLPKNKKKDKRLTLLIAKDTYAVKKIIKYYANDFNEFVEIGFKEVGGKWYLDYSRKNIFSTFFEIWQPNSEAVIDVLAIYSIDKLAKYDKAEFKKFVSIVAEPIRYHLGDWSESFWESYNYVPLPVWIRQKLDAPQSK